MKLISILTFGLIEIGNAIVIGIMICGVFTWRFEQGMIGRLLLLFVALVYALIWLRVLQMMIRRIREYVKDHERDDS